MSAPWWLTVELQVEYSPPRTPMRTFGDPEDPQDPPQTPRGDVGRPLWAHRGSATQRPHRDTLGH